LVLGGFFGLGIVIACQFLFASFNANNIEASSLPSAEILAVPLVLSYFVILGLRFAFDMPIEMSANWVFRLFLDNTKHECIPLARKVILTFALPWVFAIVLPLYGYLWGWRAGLMHTGIVTLWSLLLTEILLVRFRKIPFTCSYPPFRDSAVVLALSYVLGFFGFVVLTSNLEHWALLKPILMASLIAIAIVAWYVLSRVHQGVEEIDKKLIFEENSSSAFELLDLGGRS
jgi:hypothetical protein